MALILNLETATKACSVALAQDGALLAIKEQATEYSHAENLTLFIQDVLDQAGKQPTDLEAVAVSSGPGSYTGLRIGTSTAKGLCFGLKLPLIAIGTLRALMELKKDLGEGLHCPMLDARRMEVYAALFDPAGQEIRETRADIVEEGIYDEYLDNGPVYFYGDGATKCKEVLCKHPNAQFIDNVQCSPTGMCELAETAFAQQQFEDMAYFEPFYLKDFVATTPRKLL